MLSQEEAVMFASDTLKVSVSQDNPLQLLNQLIRAFLETIPFHSAGLQSKPLQERGKPTLEEVKREVMSKRGGLCYHLNVFMKELLEKLGFKVYLICSQMMINNDHILSVAVIEGSRYLVDVGNGYPFFEAIPIDFEKESKVYKHSFLEYKFVNEEGTGKILRFHRRGEEHEPSKTIDGWRVICIIDPTPRELPFFDDSMSLIFSSPDHLLFHASLRVVVFPKGEAVVLRDGQLYTEDSNTHELVLRSEMSSHFEILEKIKEVFPLLYDDASKIVFAD